MVITSVLSGIGLAITCSVLLKAEQVPHHGYYVDSEGTHTTCLSCHDGIIAEGIPICLETICFYNASHPINKNYPPPDKLREYVPAALAEHSGIIFSNGKISCISCHNVRNPNRYHLRVENRESKLCLTCHLK